ncbi:hypothetical protein [Utexia brackfieldae]|uniref:hypothetical protein n=1 Tax=Utexia brackfieldae TaxID=3074108 RepID=UPI00370D7F4D
MHSVTLKYKARKKQIKGYKPGKEWLFLKSDLDYYMQQGENAPRQEVLQRDNKEFSKCQKRNLSASVYAVASGNTRSHSRTVPAEYAKALGLQTKNKL